MLTVHGASRQIGITDVRFGSLADIAEGLTDVCFTPKKRTLRIATSMSALCQKRTYAVQRSPSAAIAGNDEFSAIGGAG